MLLPFYFFEKLFRGDFKAVRVNELVSVKQIVFHHGHELTWDFLEYEIREGLPCGVLLEEIILFHLRHSLVVFKF